MILSIWSKFFQKIRGSYVKNSNIDLTAKIESGCSIIKTSIGKYSFCGYDCLIYNASVGNFCSIGSNVRVGGVDHPLHFVSTSSVFLSHKDSIKKKFSKLVFFPEKLTKIGHDVWIADNVLIKAGVSIGNGAVVGMGSVVTKDIPPYAVYAGNPARLIKYRFTDGIIDALTKSDWFNYSEDELLSCADFFDDPEKFISKLS